MTTYITYPQDPDQNRLADLPFDAYTVRSMAGMVEYNALQLNIASWWCETNDVPLTSFVMQEHMTSLTWEEA